jgi:uncharacterized protein YdeI (BOF family)
MGGEKETVASQKVETETGVEVVGSVRYHISKGQVHFHDDANKLKVAIPVATWYKAWTDLSSSVIRLWCYVDTELGTMLTVEISLKKASPKKNRPLPQLDALIRIEKISTTEEFAKLNKFSLK